LVWDVGEEERQQDPAGDNEKGFVSLVVLAMAGGGGKLEGGLMGASGWIVSSVEG
jgi:hypothetical protein